ncbi:hypothetical protein EVAR_21167_1 [Eumeta japonica]|uniref:Uncharacterized protein n=1 Tax=Eumeta variegata TaxID=151549 RepID=A0A4C1UNK4_EUMVA|nr:hypothetical protein EVAR_21167_1 [Eumeta japonica]
MRNYLRHPLVPHASPSDVRRPHISVPLRRARNKVLGFDTRKDVSADVTAAHVTASRVHQPLRRPDRIAS